MSDVKIVEQNSYQKVIVGAENCWFEGLMGGIGSFICFIFLAIPVFFIPFVGWILSIICIVVAFKAPFLGFLLHKGRCPACFNIVTSEYRRCGGCENLYLIDRINKKFVFMK